MEELHDVEALSSLEKQVLGIGLSLAEFDDAVMKEFPDTGGEIELAFLERPVGRESETVDREVVDVHEDPLRSPEPIFEFEEEPSRSGCQISVQVEVKEKRAAGRLTHLKEHRHRDSA